MKEEAQKRVVQLWRAHPRSIIGAALGLFVSLLILCLGFKRAALVIFCVLLGYFVGKRTERR
jgi:uncharacterized membrane protein